MTDRLFQSLLLATALSGTAALVLALSSVKVGGDVRTAASPVAHPAAITQKPWLLPTVDVRPDPAPIPTLATVTVRATLPVTDERAEQDLLLTSAASTPALYPLPSAAFDMPYYSFGRTLRRVNKE
jgi:hypothetical protein